MQLRSDDAFIEFSAFNTKYDNNNKQLNREEKKRALDRVHGDHIDY